MRSPSSDHWGQVKAPAGTQDSRTKPVLRAGWDCGFGVSWAGCWSRRPVKSMGHWTCSSRRKDDGRGSQKLR